MINRDYSTLPPPPGQKYFPVSCDMQCDVLLKKKKNLQIELFITFLQAIERNFLNTIISQFALFLLSMQLLFLFSEAVHTDE